MGMGNSELVKLSGRCERAIRKYFTSLNDNRFAEIKMFTFGGLVV